MANELVQDAVIQWATDVFANDVETGLVRARTFDGMLSQIVIGALKRFSPDELGILARVLPLGVASTGPSASVRRDALPLVERQLVEKFQKATFEVQSERWAVYSEYVHRTNSEDAREEAKSAVNIAGAVIKEIASNWGFSCSKLERAVWRLAARKKWGELSVQFDLSSTLEIKYGVFVYDNEDQQLRRHDHYLGVLGVGPSVWALDAAAQCPEQLKTASEMIRWHLEEYERILAQVFTK